MSTPHAVRAALVVLALGAARAQRAARRCRESGAIHRHAADRAGPAPGRAVLQPARAGEGRQPRRDRLRLPGRDAGQPAEHLGGADVPLRARPSDLEAQPRHHRLRGVQVQQTARVRRCGWPTPVASTRAAAGAAAHPGRSETLDIRLVSENGQWRIDNPVNALVVPTSFFDRSFARFNLYFYDQTGRALLPDPVFIPRGEQTATNLVRGLLAGPGSRAGRGQPLGAALAHRPRPLGRGHRERRGRGAAVARGAAGLARRARSRASTSSRGRCARFPGIDRVRITVGGAPVPLPGGRIDAPVTAGTEFDAGGNCRAPSSGACAAAGWSTSPRPPEHRRRPTRPARLLDAQPRRRASRRARIAAVSGDGTHACSSPLPTGGRVIAVTAAASSAAPTCCGRRTTCSATCGWWTGRRAGRACSSSRGRQVRTHPVPA